MAEAAKAQAKARPKANAIKATDDVNEVTTALARGNSQSIDEILAGANEKWQQRHEGAVIRTVGHFGHPTSKRMFDRYYSKMSQYLFFIPVYGRAILTQKNQANVLAVEKTVLATLERSITHLDNRIREAELLIATRGLSAGEENVKMEVEVVHASPLDRKFYSLLQKADTFLLLNHALWIQGELDESYDQNEKKRTDNEWEVKRILKGAVYGILTNQKRLMNHIRRAQQGSPNQKAPSAADDNSKPSDLLAAERAAESEAIAA